MRQDWSRSHKNTFDTPSWRAIIGGHGKCLVLSIFRGNIGDIRLTSWCKFFTVRGGAKRPSNVEITCHQNLSFLHFFQQMLRKRLDF